MTRYAIYFVPAADSAIWQFGCAALGYDSQSRENVPFHDHPLYQQAAARDWTQDPRRYGFHATLKPPFELAAGTTIEALEDVAKDFVKQRQSFQLDALQVSVIGNFVALVPAEASAQLNQLAADCVQTFEPFRAPLTPVDRDRRLKSPLSERQISNLDEWGYPYVFDEFRFHMTLTGRLPDETKMEAVAALTELYERISTPLSFDGIAICEQPDRNSQFFVRQRLNFGA